MVVVVVVMESGGGAGGCVVVCKGRAGGLLCSGCAFLVCRSDRLVLLKEFLLGRYDICPRVVVS